LAIIVFVFPFLIFFLDRITMNAEARRLVPQVAWPQVGHLPQDLP
jgi:hypothetical protein